MKVLANDGISQSGIDALERPLPDALGLEGVECLVLGVELLASVVENDARAGDLGQGPAVADEGDGLGGEEQERHEGEAGSEAVVPLAAQDPRSLGARFADVLRRDRLEAWRGFGGIRIEDDVRITDGAPEVLTEGIPKAPEDLEALVGSAELVLG